MKYLLDTCVFLWVALEPKKLSTGVREAFQDPENDVYLSCVSSWEISVKYALGKLPLPDPPEILVPNFRTTYHLESLDLTEIDTLYNHRLERIHSDPFDRLLICQALAGDLTIITPDPDIRKYPVKTLW